MIELHLATSWIDSPGHDLARHGLNLWDALLLRQPAIVEHVRENDLDIILSGIDRRYGFSHGAVNRIALGEAFGRARGFASTLATERPRWIVLCGHHSEVAPRRAEPFNYALLGPEAVGAIGLFEGGANLVTHDGALIHSENWTAVEAYFLDMLQTI